MKPPSPTLLLCLLAPLKAMSSPHPNNDSPAPEPCPPSSTSTSTSGSSFPTAIPYPNLTLPTPSLTPDFRIAVDLNPKIPLGIVPSGGTRNWISFSGGNWTATWGAGTVEAGGQDSQVVEAGTFRVRMETAYLLRTGDEKPAFIQIQTRGFRTGPKEVLEKLQDPVLADTVSPSEYLFRLYVYMETGDPRYAEKVNFGMWVGSGMRKGSQVIYDAYRIS